MAAVGDIFGDGGAFPELHYEQYPLGMGKKASSHALTRRAAVPTRTEVTEEDLRRPSEEETADLMQQTAALLADGGKQVAKVTTAGDGKATFIRYTPKQSGPDGARIIRLVEAPVDPLEPPKFKHKRVPRGPPSPPAPVNHSPPRKLTPGDMAAWKIPPCISNWKNPKGYTIPLDKRLAADGRGLQESLINDSFAKLAESLFIAERNARDEVEHRLRMAKQLASKQKQKKEEELRKLAIQAKEERARGNREEAPAPEVDRYELKRELEREKRKEARAGRRDKDRDISEKVALGQATQSRSSESFYDTRLFNQHSGLGGGFGNDEDYNVYDKALFRGTSGANYRPDKDRIAAERDRMGKTEKFSQSLEFEKDQEDDPFGLGQILTEAKGSKRRYDEDAGDSRKKQRA